MAHIAALTVTPPSPAVIQKKSFSSAQLELDTPATASAGSGLQKYTFGYYCSSHGFGHATRVSALTSTLLAAGHRVYIVTSAPTFIFQSVIEKGAIYRKAKVDPTVYQPTAYKMDRRRTVESLKEFVGEMDGWLDIEKVWLKEHGVDCVLSDAVFAACAAASHAGIPSSIVSNFTFDPVYSYLSSPSSSSAPEDLEIPDSELFPLVQQVISHYACASLLLRLPGAIPLPSFDTSKEVDLLDARKWVDLEKGMFTEDVLRLLDNPSPKKGQTVVDVPLIFRPISQEARAEKHRFRERFFDSLAVPSELRNHKILLVSFGGQSIPKPKSTSATPRVSPKGSPRHSLISTSPNPVFHSNGQQKSSTLNLPVLQDASTMPSPTLPFPTKILHDEPELLPVDNDTYLSSPTEDTSLLPRGWVAVICGLNPRAVQEVKQELPERFFVIENKDVYVPDLTEVADVVLGKLGYGTCSETLSTRTPFVFVPRPLFVEEYGLKRLMMSQGVCLEMSRENFEEGNWATYIEEAYAMGEAKWGGKEIEEREDAGSIIVKNLEKFLKESSN